MDKNVAAVSCFFILGEKSNLFWKEKPNLSLSQQARQQDTYVNNLDDIFSEGSVAKISLSVLLSKTDCMSEHSSSNTAGNFLMEVYTISSINSIQIYVTVTKCYQNHSVNLKSLRKSYKCSELHQMLNIVICIALWAEYHISYCIVRLVHRYSPTPYEE